MKKSLGKHLGMFLVISLLALLLPAASKTKAADFPLASGDGVIVSALDYLSDIQEANGSIGGLAISSWAVMAIAAAGEDPHQWGSPSIVSYLSDNPDQIDWDKATDIERAIMGIVAAGEDPTDFGGEDYVSALKSLYDGAQIGYADTVNDDFWGILALIAAGESPSSAIIQNTVDFIVWVQNEDGGWNWEIFEESDVDDTAAAIMALVAAGNPNPDVIDMALLFLMNMQNEDGGFPSLYGAESNSASDAWVISALVAAGEDPTLWESGSGSSPVENLLSLQDSNGSFKKTASLSANPEFMTAYAIPALLGDAYPVTPFAGTPPEEADLIVSDIDVLSTIYVDDETVVTATIKNTGGEDIDTSFRVRLYADSDSIDTVTLSGLDADDDVAVELEWTPDEAGSYTLTVVADLDDDIDEDREDNNEETLDVEVEESPEEADLIVSDIDVLSTIYVDDETVVTATIENTGDEGISDTFQVSLNINGSSIAPAPVSGLDAGASLPVEFKWTPLEAGEYIIEVVADTDGAIAETSESNNRATANVTVTGTGSISSSSISATVAAGEMDFGAPTAGGTSDSYLVTLTNSGGSDILVTAEVADAAGGFYASALKLDGAPWEEFSVLIARHSSRAIQVSLEVPVWYSGEVLGDGILTFWTALAP